MSTNNIEESTPDIKDYLNTLRGLTSSPDKWEQYIQTWATMVLPYLFRNASREINGFRSVYVEQRNEFQMCFEEECEYRLLGIFKRKYTNDHFIGKIFLNKKGTDVKGVHLIEPFNPTFNAAILDYMINVHMELDGQSKLLLSIEDKIGGVSELLNFTTLHGKG